MSMLNIPIQINGNISRNGAPSTYTLKERELFVDKSGYLYFGKDNSNNNIRCKEADTALNLSGDWSYISNTEQEAKFGHIILSTEDKQTVLIGDDTEQVKKCYLKNFILQNTDMNNCTISDLTKLVLSDSMCGKTLPTTGVDKQVFFLIS